MIVPATLARSSATALILIVSAFGLFPARADAAVDCVYTPKIPHRIAITKSVTGLAARLKIAPPACLANFDASTTLERSSDATFLMWDNTQRVDHESIYDSEVKPGVYHTHAPDCDAWSADFSEEYSCRVAATWTLIKFGGRTHLTAQRESRPAKIDLSVQTKRYKPFDGFKPDNTMVAIQIKTARGWKRVHRVHTTHGRATWTAKHPKTAVYRAVSVASTTVFSASSSSVRV